MSRCEIYGKSYTNETNLAIHIGAIHEGKKPFEFDICDYSCSQKIRMNTHISSVHEGKKPFKCEICDYIFRFCFL